MPFISKGILDPVCAKLERFLNFQNLLNL